MSIKANEIVFEVSERLADESDYDEYLLPKLQELMDFCNNNQKITIPTETWIELYSELSSYVENKCYPNRDSHNERGERIEETEDDFCEIVNDLENILKTFFIKGDN